MTVPSRITLPKEIVAIQIESSENGKSRCGLLSRLPQGAELTISGDGFNQRTAKVRCHGQIYFVFLQDLEWVYAGNK